jgi:nucleoside diphosphate kinase
MTEGQEQQTLVVIKPDSFWRNLNDQVENRIKALGLTVVTERLLAGPENLPVEKWREFYFPAIGNRPPCLEGTSKYMAHGPVKAIHLKGMDAVQKVRSRERSAAISGPAQTTRTRRSDRNFSSPATISFCST